MCVLAPRAAQARERGCRELEVGEAHLRPLEREPCHPADGCRLELRASRARVRDHQGERVHEAEPAELTSCMLCLVDAPSLERTLEASVSGSLRRHEHMFARCPCFGHEGRPSVTVPRWETTDVLAPVSRAPVSGISAPADCADDDRVIWPVAVLAVLLLGFVVVYGSTLQSRLEGQSTQLSDDVAADSKPAV